MQHGYSTAIGRLLLAIGVCLAVSGVSCNPNSNPVEGCSNVNPEVTVSAIAAEVSAGTVITSTITIDATQAGFVPETLSLSLISQPTSNPFARTLYSRGTSGRTVQATYEWDSNDVAPGEYALEWRYRSNTTGCVGSTQQVLVILPAAPAPTLVPPLERTVAVGDPVQFVAQVRGSGPLRYQWERSIDNGVNFVPIAGADSLTLDLSAAADQDAGLYRLRARNPEALDGVVSAAARLTLASAPLVTTQPQSTQAFEGGEAAFSVSAIGATPLSYAWLRNGVAITGNPSAGTDSLALAGVTQAADQGAQFSVRISNALGEVTSAAATLTVVPLVAAARGLTDVVSVDPLGQPGQADSAVLGVRQMAISEDGRYVAFVSQAQLASSHAACGVFLRDRLMQRTELLSLRPNGSAAEFNCTQLIDSVVAMTPDARHVAFDAAAGDLALPVDSTIGVRHLYVRDTCIGAAGCTPVTQRVSIDNAGSPVALVLHDGPMSILSDDGQQVAFVAQVGGGFRAMVRDRQAGRTRVVSRAPDGSEVYAFSVAISGNGRFVAFDALTDAASCNDGNYVQGLCVFVHDRDLDSNGVFDEAPVAGVARMRTVNVSVNTAGQLASGGRVFSPWISQDGRIVTYMSYATNLGATTATGEEGDMLLFAHDRDVSASGAFDTAGNIATVVASVDAAGNEVRPSGESRQSRHSRSGRFVVMVGDGNWAPPNTTDPVRRHLVLRDLCIGAAVPLACTPQTVRLTVRADGSLPESASMANAVLSGDARSVVFAAAQADLMDWTGDGQPDVIAASQVYLGSTGVAEQ